MKKTPKTKEDFSRASTFAARLFKKTGLTWEPMVGPRVGQHATTSEFLWKIAILLQRGRLVEGDVWDAAYLTRENASHNPVGYFRTMLEKFSGQDRIRRLVRSVRLPRGFAAEPPRPGRTVFEVLGLPMPVKGIPE